MKTQYLITLIALVISVIIFLPVFFGKVALNGNLLVTFYKIYDQNIPFKSTAWDQIRQFYPALSFTQEQYRSLEIPLWNPYLFSGYPHLANLQSAVLYPITIISTLFPQTVAWHILRISPYILAALFMYLFLKNLKLAGLAASFGALFFAFSPIMLAWNEEVIVGVHVIAWLPLTLYAIDKFQATQSKKYLVLIAISEALSLFAGHLQIWAYATIFAICYFLIVRKKSLLSQNSFKIFFAFALAIGLCAIQLFPSFEIYFNSNRLDSTGNKNLITPVYTLTYLAPDLFGNPATRNYHVNEFPGPYYEAVFFIGIVPLIFALSLVVTKKRDRLTNFLIAALIVAIFTSLNILPNVLLYLLPIPFFSSTFTSRILFIATLSLITLASISLDLYLKDRTQQIFRVFKILFVSYFLLIGYLAIAHFIKSGDLNPYDFTKPNTAFVALRNLVIPFSIFIVASILLTAANLLPKHKRKIVVILIVITLVQNLIFAKKYFTFSEAKTIFPTNEVLSFIQKNQGLFRTWSVAEGRLENNFPLQYKIYSPEGYDPASLRTYSQLIFSSIHPETEPDKLSRSAVDLGQNENAERIVSNPNLRKLIDLLAVKYVIAPKNAELTALNFKKVFQEQKENGMAVFENLQVLERAFLVTNYQTTIGNNAIKKLMSADFDFRNTITLESAPPSVPTQIKPAQKAQITTYEAQNVIIETNSENDSILFLSDNYYPGWKAKVDGTDSPVLKANYTFRGVVVPKGKHTVTFYFDNQAFKIGFMLSLASLAMVISLLLLPSNKSVKRII